MLKVNTFFRIDGQFIDAESFRGSIPDIDYIEGALSIIANGRQLIGQEAWDYIDQLWSYIVDGIYSVATGSAYTCYFPDQPVKISFEPVKPNLIKLTFELNGERSAVIERNELIEKFSAAATVFFKIMGEKVPEHSSSWNDCLDKLSSICAG